MKSRCFPDQDPPHGTRGRGRFLLDEYREQRPVEDGQFRFAGWIRGFVQPDARQPDGKLRPPAKVVTSGQTRRRHAGLELFMYGL
jgi:hypothetical protein